MRHCYIEQIGIIPAIADLTMVDERTWELNRVNVPQLQRGQGHGSRLLRRVLEEADADDVTIWLYPHSSGPLDNDDLIAWYRRHGFDFKDVYNEAHGGLMIRRPNPYCGLCDGAHQVQCCPALPRIREGEEAIGA